MDDIAPICFTCKTEMRCFKNSTELLFSPGCYYTGNTYKCPECDCKVVVSLNERHEQPYNQPVHKVEQ